jgi:hypothetical protein
VVSVVAVRVEPITIQDLYTQLVSFDQRMELRIGTVLQTDTHGSSLV